MGGVFQQASAHFSEKDWANFTFCVEVPALTQVLDSKNNMSACLHTAKSILQSKNLCVPSLTWGRGGGGGGGSPFLGEAFGHVTFLTQPQG